MTFVSTSLVEGTASRRSMRLWRGRLGSRLSPDLQFTRFWPWWGCLCQEGWWHQDCQDPGLSEGCHAVCGGWQVGNNWCAGGGLHCVKVHHPCHPPQWLGPELEVGKMGPLPTDWRAQKGANSLLPPDCQSQVLPLKLLVALSCDDRWKQCGLLHPWK